MVRRAPLNSDRSLRRSKRVLREENVQERCPSTLDTSSNSWIASTQCFKGAEQQKRQSSKNVYSPLEEY